MCPVVCAIVSETVAAGFGASIALTAIPMAKAQQKNARGTHPGIADEVVAVSSNCRAVGFCVGSSRTSREAVARASTRACGHSGIWAMLCTRQSIIAAFGNWAHLAASAHGSCPSRARIDRIVSCEPFNSVPTSAKRNVFRPEVFQRESVRIRHVF